MNKVVVTMGLLLGLFCASPSVAAPQSLVDEAVQTLQQYLRLDTTNPPGNELLTATFLKQLLDKEGIENQLLPMGNNRANLFAILRGDGSRKPLVLLHHMDVVPADPQYWSAPPFSGIIKNGYLWGRGAIDIKGKGIVDLMTLIRLKRAHTPLKRDLVFLAVADEEVGSTGSKWMIAHPPEWLKRAEFLIDEGETIRDDGKGKLHHAMIGIGEKSPLWLTLTFKGQPGHGSVPLPDSSVNRALRAAQRILAYSQQIPFQVVPGLEDSLRLQFPGDITRVPGYQGSMSQSLKNPIFLNALAKVPALNALIRNTISITGMSGSDKINIIPNQATLKLDCRLIPGVTKETFLADLKRVIADPSVTITVEEYYQASYSPADSPFVQALQRVLLNYKPSMPLIPTIFTSSTDSSLFRAMGLKVYGFESTPISAEVATTAHGNDERIAVTSVATGLDVLHKLILELNR